jgi:hypothetical protein
MIADRRSVPLTDCRWQGLVAAGEFIPILLGPRHLNMLLRQWPPVGGMNLFIFLIELADNEAGECHARVGARASCPPWGWVLARFGDGNSPVFPLMCLGCR